MVENFTVGQIADRFAILALIGDHHHGGVRSGDTFVAQGIGAEMLADVAEGTSKTNLVFLRQ